MSIRSQCNPHIFTMWAVGSSPLTQSSSGSSEWPPLWSYLWWLTWWVNWQCATRHIQVLRSSVGRCWLTHSWVGPLCWGSLWWSTSTKHSLLLRVYEGVIQIRRNTLTHWSLCWATNEIASCLYCLNQSLGDKHLLPMHTVHLVWAWVEELGHWWMILASCVWSVMGTWLIVIVNKCGANECDMWVSVSNSGSEYKLVQV